MNQHILICVDKVAGWWSTCCGAAYQELQQTGLEHTYVHLRTYIYSACEGDVYYIDRVEHHAGGASRPDNQPDFESVLV